MAREKYKHTKLLNVAQNHFCKGMLN